MPNTLTEAIDLLQSILPLEDIEYITKMTSPDQMIETHHYLGRAMRNEWGLWGTSPIKTHMESLGFTHADDMSSVILEGLYHKLHGTEIDIPAKVLEFQQWWASHPG